MLKTLECRECGALVHKCDQKAESVICHECVNDSMRAYEPPVKRKLVGYPKGWRFMKEFVHADGTVYFRGVEQPELRGTMVATVIVAKPKKTKQQKKEEKAAAVAEYAKLKKLLKKETRKTHIKKLESKMNRLQKLIQ